MKETGKIQNSTLFIGQDTGVLSPQRPAATGFGSLCSNLESQAGSLRYRDLTDEVRISLIPTAHR